MKLDRSFFNRDTIMVAKELLGKVIVRKYGSVELVGRIVETEAYTGYLDKGSHTYNGKRTNRTEVMYGEAGHLYVYLNYGMYNLTNIVTNEKNLGEAVLLRGIEPISEIEEMSKNRFKKSYEELNSYQRKNFSNGPGKLSMAMNITRDDDGKDLCSFEDVYLRDDGYKNFSIVESKRVGIDYAEEAIDFLYRFYIEGSDYVSVK
ncbi:DNA-3-methyladenine glycosylase [Anaerosphaera aminiphila DSM 21120]|uniref:Putative 3-methyladenine DNA glycosylase n=1 Tax=Anaerosphaera aminiphila DSM 21120 TaxID=1120995 RepID=A0A1M5S3R2_9FIRM|nr:DNA-3-methyladenine glycosylase [Anaerosphaera aminiphila]SHH33119.1 DNA-3-methyladenine glycosylase [Anaerosphaera aminiphila DSM 21120]